MGARGHQPADRPGRRREVAARRAQGRHRGGDVRRGWGDDLQLRRGQFELEARVAVDALDHLPRPREQVERLAVEQEELLLDADAEFVGVVEACAQLGGGDHVAQPPCSRVEFGPPWTV